MLQMCFNAVYLYYYVLSYILLVMCLARLSLTSVIEFYVASVEFLYDADTERGHRSGGDRAVV